MDSPTVIIAFVFAILALMKAFVIVPADEQFIVERMGRFHAVLNRGVHWLVPFIDSVRLKLSLAEAAVEMSAFTIQNDGFGTRTVAGRTRYQIVDGEKVYTAVADYKSALALLSQTIARGVAQKIHLDSSPGARGEFDTQMTAQLQEAAAQWGLKILGFELTAKT